MKVGTLMSSPVVSVGPDTPLHDIVQVLVEHRIGSVPVVDASGKLAGLITETDLFPQRFRPPFSNARITRLFEEWATPEAVPEVYARAAQVRAADVMTPNVQAIEADADVGEAIRIMVDTGCKRVPVTDHGRLVGMVTRHDLLRALC